MFRECINGKYHGKHTYVDEIDEIDVNDREDIDEEEKAFRNISNQEQDIIRIIKRTKEETEKKLESLVSNNKKKTLTMIAKEIMKKKTDFNLIWKYYERDEYKNLENYVKSIYSNNKEIRTIKDFEEKIIDDTVLNKINSLIA